jgi:STE24 endopeptidase
MLLTMVGLYTLFVLITLYVSVMQIGYINKAKRQKAVLLSDAKFLVAGNYAVAKEKLSICSTVVDYFVFIAWVGFGIEYLQANIVLQDEAFTNIAIVMSFVILNSVVSLPFSYYEKFVLDAEFGFNNSSVGQWIKDTLISFITTLLLGSLVVWGIYLIISSFVLWWLWSFVFIFGVIVTIFMIYMGFYQIEWNNF